MSKMSKSSFSSRKGQGMSLNTVIIAIIVLVVLVVLVMIFTGYFGRIFAPGVQNCETALAGKCSTTACTGDQQEVAHYTTAAQIKSGGCDTKTGFTPTTTTGYCCKAPII